MRAIGACIVQALAAWHPADVIWPGTFALHMCPAQEMASAAMCIVRGKTCQKMGKTQAVSLVIAICSPANASLYGYFENMLSHLESVSFHNFVKFHQLKRGLDALLLKTLGLEKSRYRP